MIFLYCRAGEIIGVTGPVACGKSTFGKTFLCECPYKGSIKYNGNELSSVADNVRSGIISYLGHDTELLMTLLRITCFLVMIAMYQNTSRTYVSIKKLHRWKWS